VLAVPLGTRAGRLGTLNVYSRRRGALDASALAAAEALADQVAVALTNARDFRRQQDVAAALQRTLLPPALPKVPGVRVAAVYRPATSGINVGGDWYDLLPLSGGRLALVVGDVGGHGIDAATTMGQLRTAVRAYALEGHPPPRVLELVDAFLQQVDADAYATCLYLVLDPRTGAAEWCNAGHPGPLLVAAAGGSDPAQHATVVRDLTDAGRVAALGAPLPPGARSAVGRGVLPPGSRLLLFTDGLVERRGESLDAGLERLAATAALRSSLALDRWCDELVAAQLGGREVDDDVALLAVELAPARRRAVPGGGPRVAP
jgi:serine phosphatase RsbU (regulator of sigma subunit)